LKLEIHPWYVRDDILDHTNNPIEENIFYFNMGVNGIFTEFPHLTLTVFNELIQNGRTNMSLFT
jgi:glycerophosphoryl diester phosphodiesterase